MPRAGWSQMLVSEQSTADAPVLRWRLKVIGNTAVEFGVIPAGLQVRHDACMYASEAPLLPCVTGRCMAHHLCPTAAARL